MNIIVTNKYRDLIYSTNIEVLKELNGVYKVNQIVNSFKSVFYKKIIIDATSIQDFPKGYVLKELANSFEMDKLILFLPPDNPPPKRFLSFLVNLKIYNFTDNPKGLIKLVQKSNTIEDVSGFMVDDSKDIPMPTAPEPVNEEIYTSNGRIILGISSIQKNSYSTKLAYMIKKQLEFHKKSVLAIELDKREFSFYRSPNMDSIQSNRVRDYLSANSNYEVILIDSNNIENFSNDVVYLLDPSLYEINKLLYSDRMALQKLKGKKIIFVNSLLSDKDVEQFAREANISVYYNLPPLNDRKENDELDKLLVKLGILTNVTQNNTKKGLFDIFK